VVDAIVFVLARIDWWSCTITTETGRLIYRTFQCRFGCIAHFTLSTLILQPTPEGKASTTPKSGQRFRTSRCPVRLACIERWTGSRSRLHGFRTPRLGSFRWRHHWSVTIRPVDSLRRRFRIAKKAVSMAGSRLIHPEQWEPDGGKIATRCGMRGYV